MSQAAHTTPGPLVMRLGEEHDSRTIALWLRTQLRPRLARARARGGGARPAGGAGSPHDPVSTS